MRGKDYVIMRVYLPFSISFFVKLLIQIILDHRKVTGNSAKTNEMIINTNGSGGKSHQNIFRVYNTVISAVCRPYDTYMAP